MKRLLTLTGMTLLLALGARAQSTNIVLAPGKIAVFKAGDNTGVFPMSTARVQPCFVQAFDPALTNQAPLTTIIIPTNQPNGIWINAHAGSEGGGLSRSVNREFLALEGYTGNILSPTAAKPSADPTVERGLGTVDAFGNEAVLYEDLADWFGMPPGVTQNNPTGIASTDGTNFWGTGNFAGTGFEDSGVLFYNTSQGGTPNELENYIQAAGQARIIGGTLYVVVPGQGVYNFIDPENNDAVVPLPYDPNVANPIEHPVLTNLFINWGQVFANVANFDMNSSATIAYAADQNLGIGKFTNNNGVWVQAPYYFSYTNIGGATASQKVGCFSICVDFSGTNPIIYATTMELGSGSKANKQGHQNQNRLISIVDTGVSPGTNVVAKILATAQTTNEFFGGIDFTPDLRPLITSAPVNYSTTNGGSATFTVTAQSVYALSYQWLENGTNLMSETNASLSLASLDTTYNSNTYQCVVTNQYGTVTSMPPALLIVTTNATIPIIPAVTNILTAFVGATQTLPAVSPSGTEPFTFQWYFGTNQLVDDGIKYFGSTTASLTVSNLAIGDSGNYYLLAANAAGYASNLVDILTVSEHKASVTAGEPLSVTTFAGYNTSLTATETGGTLPVTYQWYYGTTSSNVIIPLSDTNEISGSATTTLTFTRAGTNDTAYYDIVMSNGGGSTTSSVATVTVISPVPPLSSVAYSNQLYVQSFDSLPDPGSNSVNSFNNPLDFGVLITKTATYAYSLANPFDFTYPVITGSYVGGLGLSNTMQGWYGAADLLFPGVDGITRFGAQDGDQTTGGVIDFGPNDGAYSPTSLGTNRALGLLSTSTTGSTTFALKLINTSANPLNYINLSFIGELWHNGTGTRTMSCGYTLDNTATNFVLTAESISNSTAIPSLAFSFPTAVVVTTVDGTQPVNQTNLSAYDVALTNPWQPNAALWLIWSINFYGSGSGNGYAIDNLNFFATANSLVQASTPPVLGGFTYSAGGATRGFGFSFTNTPGAAFMVYSTTNLTTPINWVPIGLTTETPNTGYSTYSFTDSTGTNGQRFYMVGSP